MVKRLADQYQEKLMHEHSTSQHAASRIHNRSHREGVNVDDSVNLELEHIR